jgi:hypothetical protein
MNKLIPLLAAVGIATAACGSGTELPSRSLFP